MNKHDKAQMNNIKDKDNKVKVNKVLQTSHTSKINKNGISKPNGSMMVLVLWIIFLWPVAIWYCWARQW